jgi:hypothetical protein
MGTTADPDEEDEIEQYQHAVSQATDDDCGCAELWETMHQWRNS